MAADAVGVRMGELTRALKDCEKKYASAVRKQVRKAIAEAGVDITAKVKAASSWSTGKTSTEKHPHTSIAAATSMRANFTAKSAGVRISINRRKAPQAGLFEIGNKGGKPGPGTFRNKNGTVTKRPFFYTSIEKQTPAVERKFLAAIDQAVRDAGFK